MKKQLLFSFCLLCAICVYAQNQRIIYEYTFKSDSLNRDLSETETMVLDISKDGSRFYSAKKMVYDSLIAEQFSRSAATKNTNITLPTRNYKVSNVVSKSYPSFESVLHTTVSGNKYAVKEGQPLVWKLISEHVQIGGMNAQKAQTTFGGRNWTAWFTPEIPIQEGPYKFSGLPGLILNMEDEKGDHRYTFGGSKKLETMPKYDVNDEKEIAIGNARFNQLWREYVNDPGKMMREMLAKEGDNFKMTNKDGKELSHSEIIRSSEQRARDALKKNNNFIQLNLYQTDKKLVKKK